jgi:hypothetical protein
MYASHYIFSKDFYGAWVIVAIIWLWGTLFIAGFYPLIDGRQQIIAVFRGVTNRTLGKSKSGSSSEIEVEEVVGGGKEN